MEVGNGDAKNSASNFLNEPISCLECPQASPIDRLDSNKTCADRFSWNLCERLEQPFAILRLNKSSRAVIDEEDFDGACYIVNVANHFGSIPLLLETSSYSQSNLELSRHQCKLIWLQVSVEFSGERTLVTFRTRI